MRSSAQGIADSGSWSVARKCPLQSVFGQAMSAPERTSSIPHSGTVSQVMSGVTWAFGDPEYSGAGVSLVWHTQAVTITP